jgi:hypothetical protein
LDKIKMPRLANKPLIATVFLCVISCQAFAQSKETRLETSARTTPKAKSSRFVHQENRNNSERYYFNGVEIHSTPSYIAPENLAQRGVMAAQ